MKPLVCVLALLLAACNTASGMSDDWHLEITTTGGFTGRGAGRVTTTAARASGDLVRAVAAAQPEQWKSEYLEPGNPHGNADQIRYTLTLTREGKAYASSWFDGSAALRPAGLARVFDAAWTAR